MIGQVGLGEWGRMLKNELQLAGLIRAKLTPNFKRVHINVNPASSRFYPHWEQWFGQPIPCAQPQIDLLLVDSRLWLLAVELKYFRKTKVASVSEEAKDDAIQV